MKREQIHIKETQFKKYLPNLYTEMMSWDFPNDFTWSQKIYHFGRNDKDLLLGICKECGKRCFFNDYKFEYEPFCCGDFCINLYNNKKDISNIIRANEHKIFHYYENYLKKHPSFCEKICELNNNSNCDEILSSPKKLFLFLNDDIKNVCVICGNETDFYGWGGKKYLGKIAYFNSTCCTECLYKYRSILQTGENNSYNKLSEQEKKLLHKKQSVSMKELILSNRFTPNITNSWCHSKINIKYIDKSNTIKEISVRSSFEALFIFQNLDKELQYEKLRIEYIKCGKKRTYLVDFVDYENKIAYEIKPTSCIKSEENILKINALKKWCDNNGFECKYITEKELKNNMKSFSIDSLKYMDNDNKERLLKLLKRYNFFNL